jgi:hypothetical protein
VFGSVANIMRTWIDEVNPNIFFFNAEEASRQKLYDAFVKLIEKETSYRLNDKYSSVIEVSKQVKGKIYAFSK